MSKAKHRKTVYAAALTVLFLVLFFIIYILSSLSGLRFFVPHYFNIAGTPFSQRNYLVLFQNNYELTPSGGKISAYGILNFENGFKSDLSIYDISPEFQDHIDFSKTVSKLFKTDILASEQANFNGVIAINTKTFEDVLGIIGEVQVDDKVFGKKNVIELINDHDRHLFAKFVSAVTRKTIRSPIKWREISDKLVENLNEKHIRLQFFNTALQNKINAKNWGGESPHLKKDFIAVTLENMSETESDAHIKRTVDYRVDLLESTGKLIVTIEHFGKENSFFGEDYYGKVRIYMPPETKFLSSNTSVTDASAGEPDYSVFKNFVTVKPGEQLKIEYLVEIPGEFFDDNNYHLNILKQPGTVNDFYSVIIKIPENMSVEGGNFGTQGNFAIWKGTLRRDFAVTLDFLQDS